jgi:hypothetical protein
MAGEDGNRWPRPTAREAGDRGSLVFRKRFDLERRHHMKQWLAIVAAVAFLTVPAMVNADNETRMPPEANWSVTPGTPEVIAVPQPRVASTASEPAIDTGTVPRSHSLVALTEADAQYKAVNETTME